MPGSFTGWPAFRQSHIASNEPGSCKQSAVSHAIWEAFSNGNAAAEFVFRTWIPGVVEKLKFGNGERDFGCRLTGELNNGLSNENTSARKPVQTIASSGMT